MQQNIPQLLKYVHIQAIKSVIVCMSARLFMLYHALLSQNINSKKYEMVTVNESHTNVSFTLPYSIRFSQPLRTDSGQFFGQKINCYIWLEKVSFDIVYNGSFYENMKTL